MLPGQGSWIDRGREGRGAIGIASLVQALAWGRPLQGQKTAFFENGAAGKPFEGCSFCVLYPFGQPIIFPVWFYGGRAIMVWKEAMPVLSPAVAIRQGKFDWMACSSVPASPETVRL